MDNQLNKLQVSGDTPVPKRSLSQKLGAVLLILCLLSAGMLVARYILATKPKAKRKRPPKMQTLVDVQPLIRQNVHLIIEALGVVQPAKKVELKPQVSGPVASISPKLIPGGFVQAGETLVVLDKRDYLLALSAARTGVKKAEMDLKLEEGSQAVAKREYQFVKEMTSSVPPFAQMELALRGPQLGKVQAALDMAKIEVEKAQLNLERTQLKAPFNAVVLGKNTDVGALVSSQTRVATLVGTDMFWVELTLPKNSLQWVNVPDADKNASQRLLIYDTSSSKEEGYNGHLVQLLSDVEPNGLQARILAAVDDPIGLKSSKPQLLLGSFVRAEIQGRELKNIFRLPRASFLPGNKVLLVSADNTLIIRQVKSIWQDSQWVYVTEGLSDNEKLITSPVASPIKGMALTVSGRKEKHRSKGEGKHVGNK